MGGIIFLALLALLFYGIISLYRGAWRLMVGKVDQAPGKRKERQRASPGLSHIRVFVKALENDGYFGLAKLPDAELTYVDDPVLSRMIAKIAHEVELEWVLPEHGLRLKKVPEEAPEAFRAKYQWVVMTPTHAIGYY